MKIGIFSDTHDNIEDTKKVMSFFKKNNVELILHSGDLTAPFMIEILDSYNIKTHIVFGNIDDRFLTTKKSIKSKNITLHGDILELEIEGKKFFMNHYPKISFLALESKKYDYIIFGHTHKKYYKKIEGRTIINPGEILGRFREKTFVIYDTKKDETKFYKLK